MRLPGKRRRIRFAAGAVTVIVAIIAVIASDQPHGRATGRGAGAGASGFTTPTAATASKLTTNAARFVWPIYGFNDARTRVFDGPKDLSGPLRVAWRLGGNAPLEFPPVLDGNALFFMDDNASVNKVNASTGRRYWRRRIGASAAATPALDVKLGLLFAPVLAGARETFDSVNGSFDAVSMKSGRILWRDPVPSGTETSPLVWGDNVYFGDNAGTMYDVNARTGATIWSLRTLGPIKCGATLANGGLFFDNYAGQLFAVKASTGRRVWEENLGNGLYASPTLAYGLVYVGSDSTFDMYALSQSNGREAWSVNTGNYIYSSAAADIAPGLGPTVYFGSYSGVAYAVNASSGHVEWRANLGDPISGAASIVNDTVFFSGVYHPNYTRGYDITTGKQVFSFPDGAYTATIASPKRVYLCGHYTLYGLVPKR